MTLTQSFQKRLKKGASIALITVALQSLSFAAPQLPLSQAELTKVGAQIYQNETGGKRDNLAVWNQGENFPSLGIGHFIWFKAGEPAHFEETFPALVTFIANQGVPLPKILQKHRSAPWKTREAFNHAKSTGELNELMQFLENTQELQTLFIYQRLQNALQKMKQVSQYPDFIEMKFYEVAGAPNGLYALIDYVNFKGEGINPQERYQGEGWGLMQVLENMDLVSTGSTETAKNAAILRSFRDSAERVLTQRVKNADPKKGEERWLPGWINRLNTYQPK